MNAIKRGDLSFRRGFWLAAILSGVYVLVILSVRDQNLRITFSEAALFVQKLAAIAVLTYAARKTATHRPEQAGSWYLWALALALVVLGDIVWFIYDVVLEKLPFPSIADCFYVASYLCLWIGLMRYPTEHLPEKVRKYLRLDNLVVVIGSGISLWKLIVSPSIRNSQPNMLAYLVGLVYPVLGILLLWEWFRIIRRHRMDGTYLTLFIFGLGLIGVIVSDVFFAILMSISNNYDALTNLGWFIGGMGFILAGVHQVARLSHTHTPERYEVNTIWLDRIRSWPIYMPYVWVGIAYLVLLTTNPLANDDFYLIAGIGAIIALVIYRQVLTINENEWLFHQAQQELQERTKAQEALHQANIALDLRVKERTSDLQNANQSLRSANISLEKEISERKRAERLLLRQVKIEELLAAISARFINLPFDEIDAEIDRSLKTLGEFIGADRCYIFQFFDERALMSNTYEWCSPGVEAQKENLASVRMDDTPWWMRRLRNREVICITDLANLPEDAQDEKTMLEAQDIQSVLVMPLEWNKSLVGFFGFDSVREQRTWTDMEITLMKIAAEILVTALQRKADQDAIYNYGLRLKTLHEIDRSILANNPFASIVSEAFSGLLQLIDYVCGMLVTNHADERCATIYYQSTPMTDPRAITIEADRQPEEYEALLTMIDAMSPGGIFEGSRMPERISGRLFGAGAFPLREMPLIAAPFYQQENTIGVICLGVPSTDEVKQEQITSVKEIGHSLAIALQQEKMSLDLQDRITWMETSLREKEILLREIHHRVKNNLQIISSLLNLQSQVVQDPSVQSVLFDSQMRVRSMALIHERLYQSDGLSRISLGAYLQSLSGHLMASYRKPSNQINLVIHAQEVTAEVDIVVPIGLLLNELISNSLKHAFKENQAGEIGIELSRESDDVVLLNYYDTGMGLADDFDMRAGKSLGMRLILSLAKQINAQIERSSQGGLKYEFRIPIKSEDRSASKPVSPGDR